MQFNRRGSSRQMAVRAMPLTLLALVLSTPAPVFALPTCQGSYAATALQPLPAKIVVALDLPDRSPNTLQLAHRFLQGIRSAGVTVGPDPNVVLHVTVSLFGGESFNSRRGPERTTQDISGLGGGSYQVLPPMPSTGITSPRLPPEPPTLFLRVDATEGQSQRIFWVASVQCRVVGDDSNARAEELGRVIGAALGQRIERQAL